MFTLVSWVLRVNTQRVFIGFRLKLDPTNGREQSLWLPTTGTVEKEEPAMMLKDPSRQYRHFRTVDVPGRQWPGNVLFGAVLR